MPHTFVHMLIHHHRKKVDIAFVVVALLLAAYWFQSIAKRMDTVQWDFRGYYYSAKTNALQKNAYDTVVVSEVANIMLNEFYVYPPFTLPLFELYTQLDYPTAYRFFLLLKLAATGSLLWLWHKKFLRARYPFGVLFIVALLAFNSPIYADFICGNITVFEQFILWCGLYAYWKRKTLWFCVAVVSIALFKLTPIGFLALLLLGDDKAARKKNLMALAASLAAFGIIMLIGFLADTEKFMLFLRNITFTFRDRQLNYSMLNLMREVCLQNNLPEGLKYIGYGVAVSLILEISRRVWAKLGERYTNSDDLRLIQICFFCFVYALVMPRFAVYAFTLLLLPAMVMLYQVRHTGALGLLLVLMSLSTKNFMTFYTAFMRVWWLYYSLVIALLLWGLFAAHILSKPDKKDALSVS
jgi:hypothetical protein